MASALKKSTFLTGLAVCENPKYKILRTYNRITKLLLKMPEGSAYRKNAEEVIKHRTQIINSTEDIKVMEEKIGCGQIEEVLIQATNELKLAERFIVVRPWEPLVSPIPKNQWKWPVK